MTIEISRPEVEEMIRQRLERGGFMDAEDVVLQALRASEPPSGEQYATGEEKARAFVEWATGHRHTPPLPDEAVSRASMYPDRW
jgi:hypothetical protein